MRTRGLLFTMFERLCEDTWTEVSDVFSASSPTGAFGVQ